jgi:HK97 family phage major capsid protein
MNLQEKATQLTAALAEADAFWEKIGDKPPKDWTDEEKQAIDTLNKKSQELNDEILSGKGYEAEKAKQDVMRSMLKQPVNRPDFGAPPSDPHFAGGSPSIGQQYVKSPEYVDYLKVINPSGGEIAEKVRIDGPAYEFQAKGLVTADSNSGGALVRRDYGPWPIDLPLRPLTIRDVISTGRTGSNLVEFVRVNSLTRAAAPTRDATATSGGGYTQAAKPEASMALEIVQAGVKTIPVWMPITRNMLADAPQLESMIDNFLQSDLELALEDAIISGSGGAGFIGLENTPGLTPQAVTASDDKLTVTRKARTTALVVGRAKATGFLLNPYDWEDIDLLRMNFNGTNTGAFYFGGPTVMGVEMLWGLPVIQSETINRGTFYTGDLKQMMLWDRERGTIRMTDSHSDFFTHNLLAILAELRAAFGVLRPAAIVKGDFIVGANS